MGYQGKRVSTESRRRQRIYSIDTMYNIEDKRLAMERMKSQQQAREVDKKWLMVLIQELKEAFDEKAEVISHLENHVFSKWALYKFKRAAYLAPMDVYHALTDFPDDVKAKAEEICEDMRARYKQEVYQKN